MAAAPLIIILTFAIVVLVLINIIAIVILIQLVKLFIPFSFPAIGLKRIYKRSVYGGSADWSVLTGGERIYEECGDPSHKIAGEEEETDDQYTKGVPEFIELRNLSNPEPYIIPASLLVQKEKISNDTISNTLYSTERPLLTVGTDSTSQDNTSEQKCTEEENCTDNEYLQVINDNGEEQNDSKSVEYLLQTALMELESLATDDCMIENEKVYVSSASSPKKEFNNDYMT